MDALVERLKGVVGRLSPVLSGLKKYEANFGDEAKKTLQVAISPVSNLNPTSAAKGFRLPSRVPLPCPKRQRS